MAQLKVMNESKGCRLLFLEPYGEDYWLDTGEQFVVYAVDHDESHQMAKTCGITVRIPHEMAKTREIRRQVVVPGGLEPPTTRL
jgi:hypothetical protein